ncbi:TesA Lysophospholipase L1 and related esterases [Candidatus Nanopelagicaceae bacterium]
MKNFTTFCIIGDSAASGVGDSDKNGNYFGWGYHLVQAFGEPVSYLNVSRPGAQSFEVLHDQLPKILIESPDLVAVIVGGNDILRNGFNPRIFEENLNETLRQIEAAGAVSMLLELHDPTQIVPMPSLLKRVCDRRVNTVNQITRKLAHRYQSILLQTRSLSNIYDRQKWHVDRMHPSRIGHQFLASEFANLLVERGFEVNAVQFSTSNNRSRKDSILWMVKNGTPWFFKRSFDLLPAILLLMAAELCAIVMRLRTSNQAELYFPEFEKKPIKSTISEVNERVS